MKYLLDTCVLSELTKSRPSEAVLSWLASQDPKGRECRYSLLSLPLYMVGQLDRLIRYALSRRDVRAKP